MTARRILLLLSALTMLPLLEAAPSPCPNDSSIEGYTSLATLNNDIGNGGPGNTYILCPDTVFETTCSDDADLFLAESDTTVQCGADGSSSSGCVIKGGNCPLIRVSEGLTGVVVQGVTIDGGDVKDRTSPTASVSGGVFFQDCIWEYNYMAVPPTVGSAVSVVRALVDEDVQVGFSFCIFRYNSGGALVEVNNGLLDMIDTIVRCNTLVGQPLIVQQTGNSEQPTLELATTCFYGNTYNLGAAQVSQNGNVTANVNNYVRESMVQNPNGTGIQCDGIYQQTSDEAANFYQCFNFTSTECSLENFDDGACPTPAPNMAPSQAPNMEPTQTPTTSSASSWFAAKSIVAVVMLAALLS